MMQVDVPNRWKEVSPNLHTYQGSLGGQVNPRGEDGKGVIPRQRVVDLVVFTNAVWEEGAWPDLESMDPSG